MRGAWRWLLCAAGLALFSSGCVKGAGEPCERHADCEAGLVCSGQAADPEKKVCSPCGRGIACVAVELVSRNCAGDVGEDLLAKHPGALFRVWVEAEDFDWDPQDLSRDEPLQIPDIPLGTDRRLVVQLYDHINKTVVAWGRTPPFEVTRDQAVPKLALYLRQPSAFTRVSDPIPPEDPNVLSECRDLGQARSGHTATTLPDGRVLVVGGHTYDAEGKRVPLKSAEFFDPRIVKASRDYNLVFDAAAELNLARTGHTATLLEDGRVLVAGGDGLVGTGIAPLRLAELYDPKANAWYPIEMSKPRANHAALRLPDGRVLLSGGTGKGAATSTEIFDPKASAGKLLDGPEIPARQSHVAALLSSTPKGAPDRLLLIGGLAGSDWLDTITVLRLGDGVVAVDSGATPKLGGGRPMPVVLPLGQAESAGLLVLGGQPENKPGSGVVVDWLQVRDGEVVRENVTVPRYEARFGACSASYEGGALVAGGWWGQDRAPAASAETYKRTGEGSSARIESPNVGAPILARSGMACATLADGSVLVLGGERVEEGKPVASGIAEIFQPPAP